MAAEYKNSSITLEGAPTKSPSETNSNGNSWLSGYGQWKQSTVERDPPPHYLQPEFDEKVKRVEDEHSIALATLCNEQCYNDASKVRKKHFPEALDKEVYQVLGNFFNLMKEYHGCRKLAQRLWKGLSKKNGYYKSDGDLLVKRKLSGNQWILAHILLGFFLDLIRELDAHTSALTLKDNKHNDLLQTPPSIKVEVIREQLGLTWKELPPSFKEEIDRF
ncbi:Protein of unknown function [Pyronema omphalodes CBS 100304]|uniref:Uncharacterized protein n=1 Tax=Pyronema omphalodes (strain CBS 100304) TaxID=1076935 RepID=U4LWP9_PYROM|nr:Protein of unknown function [Pyronema omphalodes CBS 100304]